MSKLVLVTVAERKAMTGSFYVPDSREEDVTRGLRALRQEGHEFWDTLRSTSVYNFSSVFELQDTINDSISESEDSSYDYQSSDSDN